MFKALAGHGTWKETSDPGSWQARRRAKECTRKTKKRGEREGKTKQGRMIFIFILKGVLTKWSLSPNTDVLEQQNTMVCLYCVEKAKDEMHIMTYFQIQLQIVSCQYSLPLIWTSANLNYYFFLILLLWSIKEKICDILI